MKTDQPLRIVLLDDDCELRELTEAVIRGCLNDADVVLFDEGDSAWRELQTHDPDIFITDWNHLGMGTAEILLRLAEKKAKYAILVVSGVAQTEQLQEFVNRGLNITMVSKPYVSEQLAAVISCLTGNVTGGVKNCPFCNGRIKAEAVKCRLCGEWLNAADESVVVTNAGVTSAPEAPRTLTPATASPEPAPGATGHNPAANPVLNEGKKIGGWLAWLIAALVLFGPWVVIEGYKANYFVMPVIFDMERPSMKWALVAFTCVLIAWVVCSLFAGMNLWTRRRNAVINAKRYLLLMALLFTISNLCFVATIIFAMPVEHWFLAWCKSLLTLFSIRYVDGFLIALGIGYAYLARARRVKETYLHQENAGRLNSGDTMASWERLLITGSICILGAAVMEIFGVPMRPSPSLHLTSYMAETTGAALLPWIFAAACTLRSRSKHSVAVWATLVAGGFFALSWYGGSVSDRVNSEEQTKPNTVAKTGFVPPAPDEIDKPATELVAPDSHSAAFHLKDLETRAQHGDAQAQYELGTNYSSGKFVAQNYAEAVKWFRKAANQGNAQGENGLGVCYAKGQGVPQDYIEAVKWFRLAAEQGCAKAQRNLALGYATGQGVAKDQREAVKWYRKAAEQGNTVAQWNLGVCYEYGDGVVKDQVEAAKWYGKAAEQGLADAQYNLGYRYEHGDGVQVDFTKAAKWYRKAAEQGDVLSQLSLGTLYENGEGVPKDYMEAAKWFRKAAEQNQADAQYHLATCYQFGVGVEKDEVEAYKWWNLSAAGGNDTAGIVRDTYAQEMTLAMIAEGQRRSAAFVAKNEHGDAGGDDGFPKPDNAEGAVSGTGFFVTDDGYFVTCAHVVEGATSFHVNTGSGVIVARLVKKDATLDIALLKVSGTYPALPLVPHPQEKLGDSVFTIGFPNTDLQGVAPKLTKGEISSLSGIRDDPRCYQISVPVQPGNSGGALVDERGNVVGVVAARLDDVVTYEASGALPQNVNYAVKGGLVYNFLSRLPELNGKLKAPHTATGRESASSSAERAAVLVMAE